MTSWEQLTVMYWLFQHWPSCCWDDSLHSDVISSIIEATIDRAKADYLHTICKDLLSIQQSRSFVFYYMSSDMPWNNDEHKILHLIYPSCSRISSQVEDTFPAKTEKDVSLCQLLLLKYSAEDVGCILLQWWIRSKKMWHRQQCLLRFFCFCM